MQTPRQVVAPLAGARIEIGIGGLDLAAEWVAPLAGARIEILQRTLLTGVPICRSPRGSED